MKFVYAPEGAEPQEFEFRPDRLMSSEAEAIERVTGLTFGEWRKAVLKESISAQRALLWVFLKRSRPTLKHSEVEFRTGEISIDMDDDEARTVLADLEKRLEGEVLNPEEQQAMDELRAILSEGLDAEDIPAPADPAEEGEDVEGKGLTLATSPLDGVSTNGSSLTI